MEAHDDFGWRDRAIALASLGAAALSCLTPVGAVAATLEAIQGEVMVNRGNGYRFVSGTIELTLGDMVIVNGAGSAQLSYEDGCIVPIAAGSVATVGEQSPCANQGASAPTGVAPGTLAIGALWTVPVGVWIGISPRRFAAHR